MSSYPISCDGQSLQFGKNSLPIATAQTFWFRLDGSVPQVTVTLSAKESNRFSATYRLFTQTKEKTRELVKCLLNNTNAFILAQVRKIKPLVINEGGQEKGFITFEFYDDWDRDQFIEFIAPTFLSKETFSLVRENKSVTFKVKEETYRERYIATINDVLQKMDDRLNRHAVGYKLLAHGDHRFQVKPFDTEPKFDVYISNKSAEDCDRIYAISPDRIDFIHYNDQSKSEPSDSDSIRDWIESPLLTSDLKD